MIAGVLLQAGAALIAPPSPSQPQVAVSPAAMALDIVAAHADPASHVRHAVSRLEARYEQDFRANPRYLDFDKAYPGAIGELRRAMAAEAAAIVSDETPSFNQSAAQFIQQNLSAEELRVIWAFGRTPGGRRMAQASKSAALARLEQVTRDQGAFDAADLQSVQGASLTAAAGAVREEDAQAIISFGRTPAAAKYVQLQPAIDRVVGDSELAVVGRAGPRFMAAFKAVIDRRVAGK